MSSAVQAITLTAPRSTFGTRLIGLMVASLLPAIFWTGVIGFAAYLLEAAPAISALALFGTGLFLFLAAVCAPVMFRA